MRNVLHLLLVLFFAVPVRGYAQEQSPSADQHGFIPIQVTGPGIFRMGDMQIHQKAKSLTFPARIRSHAGPLSYLLVYSGAMIENSLLETDFRPYDFHIAYALLGLDYTERQEVSRHANASVQGSPVQIRIIYRKNSHTLKEPAGAWVAAPGSKKDMPDITWVYCGPHEKIAVPAPNQNGNESGAVIALTRTPDALIYAVSENKTKTEWVVHPDRTVTPGTGVTVVVKFITRD